MSRLDIMEDDYFMELKTSVTFEYTPAQKETMIDPGVPEEVNIVGVYLVDPKQGKDIPITSILTDAQMDTITEDVLEYVHDYAAYHAEPEDV